MFGKQKNHVAVGLRGKGKGQAFCYGGNKNTVTITTTKKVGAMPGGNDVTVVIRISQRSNSS